MFLLANAASLTLTQSALYSILWIAIGIIGLVVSVKIIDIVFERKIDLPAELLKGNVAVAIYFAAYILGIAYIAGIAIS